MEMYFNLCFALAISTVSLVYQVVFQLHRAFLLQKSSLTILQAKRKSGSVLAEAKFSYPCFKLTYSLSTYITVFPAS